MAISLAKIEERKQNVISLKKDKGIEGQKAQVVLCLDFSGSMRSLYQSGIVQETLERILPLGLAFDDNGEVDFYLFESGIRKMPSNITLGNIDGYINEKVMNKYDMGGTNYAPAINAIVEEFAETSKSGFFGGSKPKQLDLPVYVIFITDGENSDRSQAEKAMIEASKHGIFFQFIGIGNSSFSFLEKLDDMPGRVIDNADFFTVRDLKNTTDEDLYKKLMTEFPEWIGMSRRAGQIK
jgi:vWA found in TerF C terminus